jgi:hypothetical protein
VGLLAGLTVGATLAAMAVQVLDPNAYRFILGELDPVLVTALAALLGSGALLFLRRVEWFELSGVGPRTLLAVAALGALLAVPVLVVDLFGGFARDLNVALPASLLFYPSIAVVAVSVLQLVPLALLAMAWRLTALDRTRARRVAILLVATTEPVLQMMWGSSVSPPWANAYVGLHLLVFDLVALEVFLRSGFAALYVLRVGYYLVWHVAWGHLRIPLLFGTGS